MEGMTIAFKRVREKAFKENREQRAENKDLEKIKSVESLSFQTEKLRKLHPQQRQILSLFQKSREVNLQEIAEHLGMNPRNTNGLIKKWLEQEFLKIENPSKKARTYILGLDWERIILNKDEIN